MTNSYNLSQRPKILFIHGLNNNRDCFGPLRSFFEDSGYITELIILPGHGEDRRSNRDIIKAMKSFGESMEKYAQEPYFVIAFSQGALYLQLWLQENTSPAPLKQVLLAPALTIHRQRLIEKFLKVLPTSMKIKSFSPEKFRRYEYLTVGEYQLLLEAINSYQRTEAHFRIPTLVMIDPKDELVNAGKLSKMIPETVMIPRKISRWVPGAHHILFHPEYFTEEGWSEVTRKMKLFLET